MPRFSFKRLVENRNDPYRILTPLVDKYMLTADLSYYTEQELQFLYDLFKHGMDPRQREFHSPSNAASCLRQQFLAYLKYKGEDIADPFLRNIFDDGNWRHIRWHMHFLRMERMGLLRVVRIEKFVVYEPWHIAGTPDDVLDIPIGGDEWVRAVIDVKGANSQSFAQVRSTNEPLSVSHSYQVHDYMEALGLNLAIMWYENKNDQDYYEVQIPRDLSVVRTLKQRYRVLTVARKTGVLPEHGCTMQPDDLEYRRCRHRFDCTRLTQQGY